MISRQGVVTLSKRRREADCCAKLQTAAATSRHVVIIAVAASTRCVWADDEMVRWTLKMLQTAAWAGDRNLLRQSERSLKRCDLRSRRRVGWRAFSGLIVLPSLPALVQTRETETAGRCVMRSQVVRDQLLGDEGILLQKLAHRSLRAACLLRLD